MLLASVFLALTAAWLPLGQLLSGLVIAGVMLALFIWAVRSGQYDDVETPALRVLLEDEADDLATRKNGPPPVAPMLPRSGPEPAFLEPGRRRTAARSVSLVEPFL